MRNDFSFDDLLVPGLVAAALPVFSWWVERSRSRLTAADDGVLRYPKPLLIVGMICTVFFVTAAIGATVYDDGTGGPVISAFFLVFALLGIWLTAQCLVVEHRLEPDGLRYRLLIGGRGHLSWTEITRVRYSVNGIRLECHDGRAVSIDHRQMSSLPRFAEALLANVPAERIEPGVAVTLRKTSAGSPPSVWR